MAKYSATITADGATLICKVKRPAHATVWQGTAFINGSTFGSGTVTLQASPDDGTTKIGMKDFNGTTISATANSVWPLAPMGNGNENDEYISIYANITGSTNPSLTVTIWDNR